MYRCETALRREKDLFLSLEKKNDVKRIIKASEGSASNKRF